MNIWDQTRELLKGLQSKASSVGSVLGKTYNNLPVYNLPNIGNQKAPVPSVGNTANTILNKKFLPGQKFTVSQSAANVWKQPGFMSAGARGVIDANTLGLHPGQPVQNNTLFEKLGYGIGFGAGFANPYNLAGKAFGGLAAVGRVPTTAIASRIVPKAIQKATPLLLKTSGKVLAEELAQSGGYVGAKRLLGQEQDFKSDLLAGIGMRGVFGSAGRLFGSNIAKHRTAMSEIDIRDTKKAIMNILTNKANADYSVRFRKKDETFLRQIAGDYLDKNFAKAAPIQDIAQELMNRMRVDTGAKEFDLPRMGFAGKNQVKNNVANQSFYDTPLYHGTTQQFDNFDLAKAGTRNPNDQGFAGKGVYFSNSKEVAETFASGKDIYKTQGKTGTGRIIEARLDPKAKVLEANDFADLADKLGLPRASQRPQEMGLNEFMRSQSDKIRAKAQSLGYDAIKVDGGGVDKYGTKAYELVVFDPKHIKQNVRVAQESLPNQSFYDTPKVLYRGVKKGYPNSGSVSGTWLTSDYKTAQKYAGEGGKVIEVDVTPELQAKFKDAGIKTEDGIKQYQARLGMNDALSELKNPRVAQESKGVTKPPFSMGFAGENQVAPLRNTGMGGYTNVRSLDNPLLNNKVSEINPTLQKSTSAINLEPQGIKQQSQGLPNTEAIRSTMNQPKSSPYNTQEYIKELTEKQQQAGGSDGPRGLKQKATNFLAEVKAKLVDETAPLTDILTASEKQNKFKVLPKQDIRLQIDRALRSKNLASQFAEDNGLVDAIKKAPDLNALDQYMIAKHAANVEKQGIKTGRDLARDQQLIQDLAPQYEATAQQVNQYSRKLLDYAVKSGLIDEKLAKGLVEKYPEYVPLNRIFSELEQPNFGGTGKGVASLSRQTVVQKLQGSEREIRSPIESLLLKTQDVFSQGERNIAAKQLASYRSLPGFEGLIKEVDAGSRAPHSFSFIDNGVKKTYATTREIEAAAKALNVEQMGILGKIISIPTRMLQLGATGLNIPFVVTNVVKDEVTGFVNSNRAAKTSILNPANYVKALFSAVKHDELYKDLVRNAGGGTSFDIARDAPNLSIAKIRSPKMYTVRHPLELLRTIENLVGRGEELGRIKNFEGTRQALLKEGRTLQDANLLGGQAARENTANFARRGSFGRVINWMIPFFNAGIQGSRQMVRSFQNAPAQTSTKVAATIFTPIAVATVWNLSDPQRKQIYADIPQHEKENNIILIPPDVTQDERGRYNVIKIPLPPGLSNLGTIVRRALETTQGLDAIKFGEIATNLITAGTSVDVTSGNKLASTFTPQLAKPLVESTTNTNLFTGQRIIPDYMKNRPAELQTRPGVTPIATGIGKLLNVSPLMVENFAQTQLGGLGSQLLGKESPIGNLERRFKKASGGELLDRVYEDSTKIQAINSQAKSLLEAGKKEEALKLIQSNKDLLMKTSKVKTIRSEVDTLQEYKNKVKADTRLTQEQKNKVLTLIQQKLNELSNVYNSVNQL